MMLAKFLKKSIKRAVLKLLPVAIPATAADAALLFGIQMFVKILGGEQIFCSFGILEWFLGMILLTLLRFGLLALRDTIAESTFKHTGAILQLRFFNTLKNIHPKFFHTQDADAKLRSAFEATETLPKSGGTLMQALQAIVQLAVFFPVLAYISWQLTLTLFLFVIPVLSFTQKKLHQMGNAEKSALTCEGTLRAELEKMRDVKRFWSSREESSEVTKSTFKHVQNLFDVGVKLASRKVTLSLAIEAISIIAMTAVLALCAYMISKGYMTATDLVLYSSAVFLCYKPIKECTRAMPYLRSAATAYSILNEFENFEKAKKSPREFSTDVNIKICDGKFSYGVNQVFNCFSFNPKSSFVFLLGPNGAGKTTLLKIIAGLEILDSGKIELKKTFESSGVFFLSQGVFLPPVDILKRKCDNGLDERIIKFADVSGGLKLLEKQKHSGGEAARIGLLWALVSNAKLVLLDEPLAFISRFDKDEILRCFLEACKALNKNVIMSGHEELPESLKNEFEYVEVGTAHC